ncbi:MAG: enoyl-CoA hydratase/isomerase family protein [Actinomycetes bacterium]
MSSTLRLETRDRTLIVRFHNPPTDLLDGHVLKDLDNVGRRLAHDRRIRAVVLVGPRAGVFVPHFNLSEIVSGAEELGMATPYPIARVAIEAVAAAMHMPGAEFMLDKTPLQGLVTLLATHRTLSRFSRLPQVVIAAIDGDALGGGCEIALACDVRIMSDGPYYFGLPEVSAGIPPGAGGSVRLTGMLGPSRAVAMMLRAHPLTPAQARDAGLVEQVVRSEDVLPTALALADRFADLNPIAVRSLKRAVAAASGSSARSLRVEAAGFVATASASGALDRLREFSAHADSVAGSSPWQSRAWLDLDPVRDQASGPSPVQPSP